MSDLEESRTFDSATVDSVKKAAETNAQNISEHYSEHSSSLVIFTNDIKTVQDKVTNITNENQQLREKLIDLKARSMRDNL